MTSTRTRRWARLNRWFFEGTEKVKELTLSPSPAAQHVHEETHAWWKVMCLTGVDYFSTLGYQPGIAYLAAGALSPIATIVLVIVTLFGALPMYRRVAAESPHGQGSISMLETLLTRWKGKALVLFLLGFAATAFVVTITLSAADATAHIVDNPYVPHWLDHRVLVTSVLLVALGCVLLVGFKEAIGVAVLIVAVYLGLNLITIARGILELTHRPEAFALWKTALFEGKAHGSVLAMAGLAVLVFPRLALGLSGFETGVAVMPLVEGDALDSSANPVGRIRNTRKLLTTAAIIMSVLLISSSFVTALLIPVLSPQGAAAFEDGGEASGRALSFLTHTFFGPAFGTLYDVSTIAILWFAGASALAGLLTLVPRYLPRYGMAPEWAKATRPLVLVITLITLGVTVAFRADVEAQAGAYATGVLGLMTSGALAVVLTTWRTSGMAKWFYLAVAVVFVYAFVANVAEQPDGIKIASFFIGSMVLTSFASRAMRSTELRISKVELDPVALGFVQAAAQGGSVRIVTNRPDKGTVEEYDLKEREARETHHIPPSERVLLLEVRPGDASEFTTVLQVTGHEVGRHKVLRCVSPAIPNAIAALLIHVAKLTKSLPHVYFGWTEGNPLVYVVKFVVFGEGDTAPVTREVLRQTIDDPARRPRVHVG